MTTTLSLPNQETLTCIPPALRERLGRLVIGLQDEAVSRDRQLQRELDLFANTFRRIQEEQP